MDEKEITTPNVAADSDEGDAEDLAAMQAAIAQIKSGSAPAELEPEPEPEPVAEPAEEPSTEEEPAKEPEPVKPSLSDEEIEARVSARVQERIDAAVREASEKAAQAVIAKERSREDSARKQLRDLELKTGKRYDQLLAEHTQQQVQVLMDERGLDEDTAKRLLTAEAQTRELQAMEEQRRFEHQVFTAKNQFAQAFTAFVVDPQADASVKKLATKYQKDIEEFAYGAIENGNAMAMEVARDYVLGKHLPELLKEQEAELERRLNAKEQQVLKNVQDRSKAQPVAGGVAVPSAPTLSRDDRAFLRKLGITDEKDIADIAKRQAARKKK